MPEHREKCSNRYSGVGSRPRARDVVPLGPGPMARPGVGSIEVPREPRVPTNHRPLFLVTPPQGSESSSPTPNGLRRVTLQRCSMGHPARRSTDFDAYPLDRGNRPESNTSSGDPSEVGDGEVKAHLRNPDRRARAWTRSNRSSYIPAFTPWSCFSRQRFWPSSRM